MKGLINLTAMFALWSLAGIHSAYSLTTEVKALDTAAIDREIGRRGETSADVYKISFPRTDLKVLLQDSTVKAGFALGSWIAFKATGLGAAAHGDLALTEEEVGTVVRVLQEQGFQITAVHNHLIGEAPRLIYVHFWGHGEAGKLAHGLKEVLSKTKTPLEDKQEDASAEELGFNTEQIEAVLGKKGSIKNGVLQIAIPRSETITTEEVELPPGMGMATILKFQAAGGKSVMATGDFVLGKAEVHSVMKLLTERRVSITALHNHLVDSSPALFFLHFFVKDKPEKVAADLKAALNAMYTK